jgi:acyl-coenzyme A thioesterase PaaI-like protein
MPDCYLASPDRLIVQQLTDTVTSLTLSTLGIPGPTGVSVNISCEFVRPGGREGDLLTGVGEVVKMGKLRTPTLASTAPRRMGS